MIIKIDVEEMTDGDKVADELIKKRNAGFPWFTILDADGKELVSSNGAGGRNVGAPVGPAEQSHFVGMIEKTMQHAPAERVKQIESALAAYSEKFE
ncbi:MAG: hypothetical protein Aurels2KO_49870 [Aureliella sp.]